MIPVIIIGIVAAAYTLFGPAFAAVAFTLSCLVLVPLLVADLLRRWEEDR